MTSDVSDEYRVAPQLFDFPDEHLAVAELDAKVRAVLLVDVEEDLAVHAVLREGLAEVS